MPTAATTRKPTLPAQPQITDDSPVDPDLAVASLARVSTVIGADRDYLNAEIAPNVNRLGKRFIGIRLLGRNA